MRNFQVKSPDRKVTLISNRIVNEKGEVIQEHGMIMRTVRSYAAPHVASGAWSPTTKGKLKSFLNREARLHKNERFMQAQKINLNSTADAKLFPAKKNGVVALVTAVNSKKNFYRHLRIVRFAE